MYFHHMQRTAIIVAGGKGTRMGVDLPKQFIVINGLPILGHTLQRFAQFDSTMELIVVLPIDWISFWDEERSKYTLPEHTVVEGGQERFNSVLNGIKAVSKASNLIAVHDAVRPCVSLPTIERCFAKAGKSGAAIPVVKMVNSLRKLQEEGSISVDRSDYRSVQTPQVFQADLLRESYNQPFASEFTDDASVVEKAGHGVHLVEGNPENVKATNPQDLVLLRHFLS
ncbi:MAG: 2-C-methyl-D-erythritol 4-phosphate cytidylyltransferase [Flavobacteriales bacterium]